MLVMRLEMSNVYSLNPRSVLGKKVSRLRSEGILPANLYGRGIDSASLQLQYVDGRDLLNLHGRNNLFEVQISGETEVRPVVVRDVSIDPVTRKILHIDFFQVDLQRTIQADVPLNLIGTSLGVSMYGGVLVQAIDRIMIEALPADMPEAIDVDISALEELDSQLFVRDLTISDLVTVLVSEDTLVLAVQRPRVATEESFEVAEGEESESTDDSESDESEG
ncbi:MAG TPA: 50S ribosomal protein L25 [Dehalococcoidia bacterium]|nr:50S ribosomal protein L25 [Dehalococcoidia bacterium]